MKAIVTSPTFRPMGMIGKEESEEDERVDSPGEGGRSFDRAPESDERKKTFEYLKQLRKEKRRQLRLEREDRMREETRIEMNRVLQEDAERLRESQLAAAENASVGIAYVEDQPARRKALHPVTAEDRQRIDAHTDRHTRGWYNKTLEAIIEGRLILT